jgi:hypothetical protein
VREGWGVIRGWPWFSLIAPTRGGARPRGWNTCGGLPVVVVIVLPRG